MPVIADYEITEKLYESKKTLVYRARREKSVILKILNREYPTAREIAQFKWEYEILSSIRSDGVVKVLDLQKCGNSMMLILEDTGGAAIKDLYPGKIGLMQFLPLAIRVSEILGEIHAYNVIHRDINPSNIIMEQSTGKIEIIDFGISTLHTREKRKLSSPEAFAGTLAYTSPEQTGRMNRSVDYRSDFYSLGITLYSLLTGSLPFESRDPAELIHAHLATVPPAPHEIDSSIPRVLSSIVTKLMAKTPEKRYQSATGLRMDLKKCLDQLSVNPLSKLDDVILAQHDVADRLVFPSKLYGRDSETERVLDSFNRISEGSSELLLITGRAGIGKTAFVEEAGREIGKLGGTFIAASFDEVVRGMPFAPLLRAFQLHIKDLLSGSAEEIDYWRIRLSDALGANAQLLIDLIPELTLIVGEQPRVPGLNSEESKNRFNLLLRRFVCSFSTSDHPLVLCFDNLHLADSATLGLIERLLKDGSTKGVFVIGTCRIIDPDPFHPLTALIKNVEDSSQMMTLKSLEADEVGLMLSQIFSCSPDHVESLAQECCRKTNGNPLFLVQFLTRLHADNIVRFDEYTGSWKWDMKEVSRMSITENVAELMAATVGKLSHTALEMLRQGACIGTTFEIDLLARLNNKSAEEIHDVIVECAQAEFVIISSPADRCNLSCRFVHERLHRAVYESIKEDRRKLIHLQAGRLMLQEFRNQYDIFEIVNHLNHGAEFIEDKKELNNFIALNLEAGRKAVATAAHDIAFRYFRKGLEYLSEDDWQEQYATSLELYNHAVEAAYHIGDFKTMEQLAGIVNTRAKDILDAVPVNEIIIQAKIVQNQTMEALRLALTILESLGMPFPQNPGKIQVLLSFFKTQAILATRKIENLSTLPPMKDPKLRAAMRISASIASAAYLAIPNLFPLIFFKHVRLSVKHGNTRESAFAYANYGLFLCAILHRFDTGYRFGNLALRLVGEDYFPEYLSRTRFIVDSFIRHYKDHAAEFLPSLAEAHKKGMESGDFEFSIYCTASRGYYLFLVGKELPELVEELADNSRMSRALGQLSQVDYIDVFCQAAIDLMEHSEGKTFLSGPVYNMEDNIHRHLATNNMHIPALCNLLALQLNFLCGNHLKAIEFADKCEEFHKAILGFMLYPVYKFYDSLARLAVYRESNSSVKRRILTRVRKNQNKMKRWATSCPANYANKYWLVEAERDHVTKKGKKALEYFDLAIKLARENGFCQEEALAKEMFAHYWFTRGKDDIAMHYLNLAVNEYDSWGARAKAEHVLSNHESLRYITKRGRAAETDMTVTTSTTAGSIDQFSVLKASQVIATEIRLSKLLERIMKIVLENAGARKGILLLITDDTLYVEAEAESTEDGEKVSVMQHLPADGYPDIPRTVINYVSRLHEPVLMQDAKSKRKFAADKYMEQHNPESVFCMPLIYMNKLNGILYLENNLVSDVFYPNRIEMLEMLSAKMVISIDNARLYEQLEEHNRMLEDKVSERTRELEYTNLELRSKNEEIDNLLLNLNAALQNMVDGFFVTSTSGVITLANPAFARMSGLPMEQIQGKKVEHVLSEKAVSKIINELLSTKGREIRQQDFKIDNSVIRVTSSAIYTENGFMGVVTVLQDRTREWEIDRMKTDFISMVSHELRTPLTSVLGFAAMIAKKYDTVLSPRIMIDNKKTENAHNQVRQNLKIIVSEGERLTALINDLLDIAKMEAGKVEWNMAPNSIYEIVEHAIGSSLSLFKQKNLEIKNEFEENVPHIVCDRDRIIQVVVNLLSNAVKFTETGLCVTCKISRVNQDVVVQVIDEGIGIPQEYLSTIFDKFKQIKDSKSTMPQGTGLGLPICREIIEYHEGRIWVESTPGKGSIFSFSLPLPHKGQ